MNYYSLKYIQENFDPLFSTLFYESSLIHSSDSRLISKYGDSYIELDTLVVYFIYKVKYFCEIKIF